jgi:serine/threonine protein phosphatase PrpC
LNVATRSLQVGVGFATEKGRRPNNQDYVGAHLGGGAIRGVVAAFADGVAGRKGGRQAAELTIRSFNDAYCALPETMGVQLSASRALAAANQWVHAQGRCDPELAGMSCTFSSLILSRRSGHVLHVGDCRIYRLTDGQLDCLTNDHVLGRGELAHVLLRAIGFEESVKVDHLAIGPRQHDRFLLCTDGVHGALSEARLKALLEDRAAPEESARIIVRAALNSGGQDNATALILDVIDVPPADHGEIVDVIADLPVLPLPKSGDVVDGYLIREVVSDSPYSRIFRASDGERGGPLVLKFPHPSARGSPRAAVAREAWVCGRVRSPWIGEIIETPPTRQTRLYSHAALRGRDSGAAP